jgi:hypothetical protein
MFNTVFETFFCPVHGIFRPEILGIIYQSGYVYLMQARALYFKMFGGL